MKRFDAVDPTDGRESSRYSLSYATHHQDQTGAWEVNAFAAQPKLDLYSNFTYFLNHLVDGDQFNQSERRILLGASLNKNWLGDWHGLSVTHRLGLQTRYDKLSAVALYQTLKT